MSDDRLERLEKEVDDIQQTQIQILKELERYKGFWGGIIIVGTAVAACVSLWFGFKE